MINIDIHWNYKWKIICDHKNFIVHSVDIIPVIFLSFFREFRIVGFPSGSVVKNLPAMQETQQKLQVWSLGQEDLLEKEMATRSSTLVWKMPWTEKSGGLKSMGSQRVWHDQSIIKDINPEYSLEELMLKLKLQYFGDFVKSWLIGKDPNAGKDWTQKEKRAAEDDMVR